MRERPHSLIVLENPAGAHPDVMALLTQVLRRGQLTDGLGRVADFSSTVVAVICEARKASPGGKFVGKAGEPPQKPGVRTPERTAPDGQGHGTLLQRPSQQPSELASGGGFSLGEDGAIQVPGLEDGAPEGTFWKRGEGEGQAKPPREGRGGGAGEEEHAEMDAGRDVVGQEPGASRVSDWGIPGAGADSLPLEGGGGGRWRGGGIPREIAELVDVVVEMSELQLEHLRTIGEWRSSGAVGRGWRKQAPQR